MAANFYRPNLKRPLPPIEEEEEGEGEEEEQEEEEEEKNEEKEPQKPPMQKKVRFPKGKKAKHGDEMVEAPRAVAEPSSLNDPRVAAKERAKRRGQLTTAHFKEDGKGLVQDISTVEVSYEDYETFVDDGIQIEPFSLNKEREEGYFDANMNFIEYVKAKEAKDAWLDSLEDDPKYVGKVSELSKNDDEVEELTTRDIGTIKRRIADVLEPGETVLQALRRLKGSSNNRKDKMSSETKSKFDQLTEDAMALLENGEYDVYHEKQEIFQREAEGYESLARARGEGSSISAGDGSLGNDILSGLTNIGVTSSESVEPSSDSFDMFADDDELPSANPSSEDKNLVSGSSSNGLYLTNPQNKSNSESDTQSDYVFDESSGYYYSSSLGYYYDPSTGLYCSAASGQWYSFNEETGTYDEVQAATSNAD